jgi:hypothetical protein
LQGYDLGGPSLRSLVSCLDVAPVIVILGVHTSIHICEPHSQSPGFLPPSITVTEIYTIPFIFFLVLVSALVLGNIDGCSVILK